MLDDLKNYELEMAMMRLNSARTELAEFLRTSYNDVESSDNVKNYLGTIVEDVAKRHPYKLEFSGGGCPIWHARMLRLVADLIQAEHDAGLRMADLIE